MTHWEKKEASANLKGDPSRVSAVIESARVSYWSKDRIDGLKVQFGTRFIRQMLRLWRGIIA